MASTRRNNTCAPLNNYEQQMHANIAINDAKLQSLNLPSMRQVQQVQTKIRKKVM